MVVAVGVDHIRELSVLIVMEIFYFLIGVLGNGTLHHWMVRLRFMAFILMWMSMKMSGVYFKSEVESIPRILPWLYPSQGVVLVFVFGFFFFNVYVFLRETETEHEQGWGRERGNTESEAGFKLWAASTEPDAGLELGNREIMSQSQMFKWLSHPRAPGWFLFILILGPVEL